MLTMVEVRNVQGDLLPLPLEGAVSGIIVKDIGGLDPVAATIVSSSFAGEDGEQYHTSRRMARDVTFTLGLKPDYKNTTVRALRGRLFKFLMPKSLVNLRFYMSDGLVVTIVGRVETCEAPLFSEEPEMNVSIRCDKPDFLEMDPTYINGETTSGTTESTIDYIGTVETGIKLTLNTSRAISNFTVYHIPPDGSLRTLDFSEPLLAADALVINTVRGSKGATITRAGQAISALRGVAPYASWIELQPGPNRIRVYATGSAVSWQIEYVNRHGGL